MSVLKPADRRQLDRINQLSLDECRILLIYLSGYLDDRPELIDELLDKAEHNRSVSDG